MPFDLEAFLATAQPFLIKVLAALAIFIIGKWVVRIAINLIKKGMMRAKMDETLVTFLSNVIYGFAMAVVIISALGQVGVSTTSAAAILGGAALAIGLSLQGQLSSLAAGVILILFRPFRKGDFVKIGGEMGVVDEIKIIHTVLKSLDNQFVIVPNNNVTTNVITNFSALPTRRMDLTIGIGYSSDLLKAKRILEELVANEPRRLEEPASAVMVKNLGESSVDFAVRFWVNTGDWWATHCDMIERIKLRFDEEGIEIPFPQRTVHHIGMPPANDKGASVAETK
ncbi:mechanosensitive ion channel family protein [Polycyclovorans algicola]|uniref:mechanosensitive ion channel family protein n=1 Tax=Polycyclovorans algicola TaxID=616992 RepID=UPI0006937FCB|nr:mechanosensitive ion channel domain-containing protein [Polycyclovorans algicola]